MKPQSKSEASHQLWGWLGRKFWQQNPRAVKNLRRITRRGSNKEMRREGEKQSTQWRILKMKPLTNKMIQEWITDTSQEEWTEIRHQSLPPVGEGESEIIIPVNPEDIILREQLIAEAHIYLNDLDNCVNSIIEATKILAYDRAMKVI